MGFKEDDNKMSNKDKIKNKRNKGKNKLSTQKIFAGMIALFLVFWLVLLIMPKPSVEDAPIGDIQIEEDDLLVEDDADDDPVIETNKDDSDGKKYDSSLWDNADDENSEDVIEPEYEYGDIAEDEKSEDNKTLEEVLNEDREKEKFQNVEGITKVHFVDVGQGDAAIIEDPTGAITLIDGGPRSSSKKLEDYIYSLGINEIDYIIATHPHEDHIGGLPNIINKIPVKKIYMPNITHTTKIFEQLLEAIDINDVEMVLAEDHNFINSGDGYDNEILYPVHNKDKIFRDKSNLNLYSIVNKASFGKTSFMFTGDAEVPIENYVSNKFTKNLSSTVLKVGHHGSNTSSSEMFLDFVNPKVAIISSGENNKYGHPHKEVMDRLKERGIEVFDTKEHGNIIIESDGQKIKIKTEK